MSWHTHQVVNQPDPLHNNNLYLDDTPLQEAVRWAQADDDQPTLIALGQQLGSSPVLEAARLANHYPPELQRYDARGCRLDEVEFHPAWHQLMQQRVASRLHNLPWLPSAPNNAFVARAARFLLHAQVESGSLCPLTMTFGATPLLQQSLPSLFSHWLPPLLSDCYDARSQPVEHKQGLLIGMGMTEKQGGSDVQSNSTRAEPLSVAGTGEAYRLVGHKWFFSVPQSDAHLVLAQTKGGLSCFLLPRWLPDGSRNAIRLERLKDKLGNHSNASCEVEFQDATGWLLGDEGAGVRHILKMGGLTRFDCALGSHGLMRRALALALHHASQRQAFGQPLITQPLMQQLLATMALRLEGHIALLMALAAAWQQGDQLFSRLLTPAAKYSLCRQGAPFIAEAMEVLGGIGYCEESEMPRLYREAPVNSIWEGSGNIMCLDVLRSLHKLAGARDMLAARAAAVQGRSALFDRSWQQWLLASQQPGEAQARRLTQQLFDLCCAMQLLAHADPQIAEAWCQMTLNADYAAPLPATLCQRLLQRAQGS